MKDKLRPLYMRYCEISDSIPRGRYEPQKLAELTALQKKMESVCSDKLERSRLTGEIHLEIYPHLRGR